MGAEGRGGQGGWVPFPPLSLTVRRGILLQFPHLQLRSENFVEARFARDVLSPTVLVKTQHWPGVESTLMPSFCSLHNPRHAKTLPRGSQGSLLGGQTTFVDRAFF